MKRLALAFALTLSACNFSTPAPGSAVPQSPLATSILQEPPEVRSSHGVVTVELATYINPSNGFPTFVYEDDWGYAPTIRAHPGDTIDVDLSDELNPSGGMGANVNLHFHGLGSSPMRPQDDVLTMLAMPGGVLHYAVKVPPTQPPGLYWYHAHVHGLTNYQVGESGLAGALVVEPNAASQLATMPEHILIVQSLGSGQGDAVHNDGVARGMDGMAMSPAAKPVRNHPCKPETGVVVTVNRSYQPTIVVQAGRPELFRVLNATGHRHIDLKLDGLRMKLVEIDGYPVNTYPGEPGSIDEDHIVIPVAARAEFVAVVSKPTELRSQCFFSGPYGDPDPAFLLAHIRTAGNAAETPPDLQSLAASIPAGPAASLPPPVAHRIVHLSENVKGFYINGKMFEPNAPPMFVVRTGTVERWTVYNDTNEVHDFHMHQVHFLVETVDGVPVKDKIWRDVALVPWQTKQPNGSYKPGRITLIADFRSPLIKGTFLFHCHILDHEDAGMMAKIKAL